MEQNQNHNSLPSEDIGKERWPSARTSEGFGTVPKDSEPFRTVRNDAESFRNIPKDSERGENHTLTVREAARMFEAAGVARTERSITNWCQPNKTGISRLDSYFDPNERKYYITPQSVELAIAEEKAKAVKNKPSETFGTVPQGAEDFRTVRKDAERVAEPVSQGADLRPLELERENTDLKITNRAKDMVIERMQKERDGFFEQVITANRKVGELEAKLLQLEGSK